MAGRRSRRVRALVLDRTKLKEQDVILEALEEGGAQLRCVAKGARKPGSRLAARTELFCDVELLLSEGRGLPIVSEAEVVDAHVGVRGDLVRLSAASAVSEVAGLTCYEDVEDRFLFPLLSRTLAALEQVADDSGVDLCYAAYVMKVLSHAGWRPELDVCAVCGEPSRTRLSVMSGGVLCESCARDVAGAERVGEAHLAWLRSLIGCTFDELEAADLDQGWARWLAGFAMRWATTHLEARLRASEFLLGL